jgi:putative addiction module component (TIGR02574 family)
LVQDILQGINVDSEEPPLTPAQRSELRRRLAGYRRDPKPGSSWPDVKSRILQSLPRK